MEGEALFSERPGHLIGLAERGITKTHRNARLAGRVAAIANWAERRGNRLTRPVMEAVAGIHRDAALPRFHRRTLVALAKAESPEVNKDAPAYGRKAVLYATCFVNYNNPDIGTAARAVLARNGVETEVLHPRCCGMPKLEHGDLAAVADSARAVAAADVHAAVRHAL